jgi:hypothetical protein
LNGNGNVFYPIAGEPDSAGCLLAAAVLVALLVGGQIAGPKVVFNAPPPIVTR